jgi:hypothetical protein
MSFPEFALMFAGVVICIRCIYMHIHISNYYMYKLTYFYNLLVFTICFNGLQRSMSTACKHIVHNCKIFYMQNVLSPSFYKFDIWFCNCSDSVKFNHIVLNMQLTGTYYTKYLSYIFVMHKAHYFVLCCLWLCHFLAYLFWILKHVHTFYISKLFPYIS